MGIYLKLTLFVVCVGLATAFYLATEPASDQRSSTDISSSQQSAHRSAIETPPLARVDTPRNSSQVDERSVGSPDVNATPEIEIPAADYNARVLASLDPEIKTQLVDHGWLDPLEVEHGTVYTDGVYSDYQSYDFETITQLAEGGDRRAQLAASMRADVGLKQRQRYARMAAAQGYTSALARLGLDMMKGFYTFDTEQEELEVRASGFVYFLAARMLGDIGANDPELWADLSAEYKNTHFAETEKEAEELVRAIRALQ